MAAVTDRPLDPDLLDANMRRHDVAGPRYTSYPTADRFVEAHQAPQHLQALAQRGAAQPLSVYVHIPFCEQLCYYCACNKVITRHHERAQPYLAALEIEMDLVAAALGGHAPVSQLHLGGGSPTFLSDAELGTLMTALRQRFRLLPGAELSIEVDPRTVDAGRLAHLKTLGFNRLSFGVQDFDAAVQKAVHRVQPIESVAALMRAARDLGFASISVDLIYGLPLQTPASFARTIAQVAELRPDRIAMYAYAHLPQRFKPQRRIVAELLPPAGDKLAMLSGAISALLGEGYAYIGMDHFALPDDPLAVAKRQGLLHRNFQGYSTQPDCDLVGLGVSAISRVGATFAQNAKALDEYQDLLHQRQLPVQRGLALTRDDLLRRAVIMALMCQGRLEFESIASSYLVDVPSYFAAEFERLGQLAAQGLVVLEPDAIQVTPLGWYFVRAVAMVFDRYLQADASRERFSKII
ncbi:oxygen-independent coproporphyrinogen III oxidase [Roseateles saccharophilus]|uniref:Coproporphyrinogen-III oxidase n=2 Tax=Roseateles saccharophilus TaxID=304 RepID=A0A4R3VLH2_ROSSA|nr:oxygen-independent coproporphyrinogen III oxidase [Roseateles saccharophilus]MDG0832504.1 oxygen-independent coproporphyrinogen III oxidase [Roseateles saccharophilus]TCV03965.1 oxygen-independent coproporphyrinogen-3 oxidase [Roseateles saccharophilus]